MGDCIFCKIIEGQIPAKKVYEDEYALAFHDIQPVAPVHILIIPKKHFASMNEAQQEDFPLLGKLLQAAQQIAREQGVADTGYRLVNNCGAHAGQVVFHYHLHLLGGSPLAGLGKRD